MGAFGRDVVHALRTLGRAPGFTLSTVLVLALGIGASTAVFSIANAVLLQPLPYAGSDRLGLVWHDFGQGAQSLPALHPLDYRDYRARARAFEDFAVATGRARVLGDESDPSLVQVGHVAAHFFPFLGIDPVVGRHFAPEEDVAGGPRVALLSHGLWARRFGRDPAVAGRKIDLDGEAYEVVGVLPESFQLLLPPEAFGLRDSAVWVPAQIDWAELPPRNFTAYTAFARIRRGTSFASAQADLDAMAAELRREHPVHAAASLRARLVPLHEDVVKRARPALLLLGGAVGFVLLVACANVASLGLLRGAERRRELLVRSAIGASRASLARLVLAESLVLAAGGTLAGVFLATLALRLFRVLAENSLPRLATVAIDGWTLGFAALACAIVAVSAGLLPALAAGRTELAAGLVEGVRSGESRAKSRLRAVLVAAEVTLSVVLLVGAGLLARSFAALQQARPGFDPGGVLTLGISLPATAYREPARRLAFHDALRARVQGLPGVTGQGAIHQLPLSGSGILQPYAYDEETARNWESVTADQRFVTPGFFDAIGARFLAGRDFDRADLENERRVVVIDETLAARAFPGRNPVGERLQVEASDAPQPYAEVIGVVAHVHLHDLTRAVLPQIYEPRVFEQSSLAVRVSGDPAALAPLLRREIRSLEPLAAVADVRPLSSLVEEATASARLSLVLMGGFGGFALLLAAIGLYGVVSYSVRQRTRELAVRLALGASPAGVRRMVLGQGARLVVASLVAGLLGAGALAGYLRSMLVGIAPWDLPTYAAAAALLAGVGLVACWLPARRAAGTDPAAALRAE